jgi:hypothetical protein
MQAPEQEWRCEGERSCLLSCVAHPGSRACASRLTQIPKIGT